MTECEQATSSTPPDLALAQYILAFGGTRFDDAGTNVGARRIAEVESGTRSRSLMDEDDDTEIAYGTAVRTMVRAYRVYGMLQSARSHSTWLGGVGSVGLMVARGIFDYSSLSSSRPPSSGAWTSTFWFALGVSFGVLVAAQARWLMYDGAVAHDAILQARQSAQTVNNHHKHRRRDGE